MEYVLGNCLIHGLTLSMVSVQSVKMLVSLVQVESGILKMVSIPKSTKELD